MKSSWVVMFSLVGLLLLSACNRHGFFYYPNRTLYNDPETLGMPYEFLTYPSHNGKKLYAILFQTEQQPKGIVVHFHGNFGNVSNHFLESQFLTKYGFDVLVFDYQGFGGSEGQPTPQRTVEDGLTTVRLAQTRNRNPKGGVVVFGQSLGAAVAAVVTAKEPLVKAVVLEAGFTSYRSMARVVMKRSFFLWPLYPIYPFFLTTHFDANNFVAKISPRPVLFIHGTQDRIVPTFMSHQLYEKAKDPKQLWLIDGADHLECRRKEGVVYEKRVADFFSNALGVNSSD